MRLTEAETIITSMFQFNLSIKAGGADVSNRVLIPYLEGVPGLGKTAIVHKAGENLSKLISKPVKIITVRLSEYEPSEVSGWNLPDAAGETMKRVRPMWLPHEDDNVYLIFFDELPQGSTSAQNTVAQAMNEGHVGPFQVPSNCVIVAAGNSAKDRAGTSHMPTHLRDRMTFLEIEPSVDDTVPYFQSVGVDTRLCAYLRFRSEMLSKFERDAKACPSPRSWHRVDSILNCKLPESLQTQAIAGQVGEGAAADFSGYLRLVSAVPDMDKLIADPQNAVIPSDPGIMYAVASELVQRYNKDTSANIIAYIRRFPRQEISSFVVGDIVRRDSTCVQHPEMRKILQEKGRSLLNL